MRGVPRERRANLERRLGVDRHVENARRSPDDLVDVAILVEIEAVDDAEARAQRRGQQAGARRRANQRELLHRHLHRPRARTLPDDDVELVVLHRRIEDLFDGRRQPMDLVDEEHLVLLEVGEHRRQVARLLDHRPGGRAHRHAQLVADHVGQRRLAESGRSVEEDVIERFARGRARRRSTPAGCRARDPGRCTRRAIADAVPPRTARRLRRARAVTRRSFIASVPGARS